VVPTEKMCAPTSEQLSFRAPSNMVSSVGPRKAQSQPSHWVPNGGILVKEENLSQRDSVTELFYSDRGGMDIQKYDIISIKRVQSIELWKSYTEVRSGIAASNWGVCNEQRLFLGTAGRDPTKLLLEDPTTLFYSSFHSDGVTFTSIPSHAHRKCFHRKGPNLQNHQEIVLSRVTLGRIKDTISTQDSSIFSHSIRTLPGGSFSISNTSQAYPEYIISYKKLHTPPTRSSRNHSSAASGFSFSGVNRSRTSQPTATSIFGSASRNHSSAASGFSFSGVNGSRTSQPTATFTFGSTTQTSVPMPANHFSSRNSRSPRSYRFASSQQNEVHTASNSASRNSRSPHPYRFASSQQNKVHTTSNSARVSSSKRVVNVKGQDGASHQKVSPSASAEANNGGKHKSSTKQCVVCLERDVRRICLPCGHPCLCEVCSTEQGLRKLRQKCPECRGIIKQVVTIFARVVDD